MIENLSKNAKLTRHNNAAAAGQTTITPTSGIDMSGFESCMFVVAWGTIAATGVQSIEVHGSDDDGVADAYTALLGTKVTVADDDDNKLTYVEVVQPTCRYLKCVVNRATADSTVDGIFAIQSGAMKKPVTHCATTVSGGETHLSPAEGTA